MFKSEHNFNWQILLKYSLKSIIMSKAVFVITKYLYVPHTQYILGSAIKVHLESPRKPHTHYLGQN